MITKKACIFLDRDGVINRERGDYTFLLNDFVINPGVWQALKILKNRGYIFIVITNQSGIALQKYTISQMQECHNYMFQEALINEIFFQEVYYCPHHPSISNCLCRKPNSILLERAICRFNIDISQSFFIGDKQRDIEAAEKTGVKGILINSNTNLCEILAQIS